jgi:hypothetical protein
MKSVNIHQEAQNLLQQRIRADAHLELVINEAEARTLAKYPYPANPGALAVAGVVWPIQNIVSRAVARHQANKVKRSATKHYKQHQITYQEQAVNEATKARVELNGWAQE